MTLKIAMLMRYKVQPVSLQKTLVRVSALLFFVMCLQFWSFAQETSGGLRGSVTDASRQPLAGATVVAIHLPSGTRYATMAGSDGRYNLPGLRVGGPYTITVSEIGLEKQARGNITIALGEPVTLNFVLSDQSKRLSEVVVRANRAAPRANPFGAGQNISRSQLRSLPTISRSLQDMTRTVPQASRDNSFTGTNFRYNNITIDGAINNDAIGFSPSLGGVTGTSGQPGSSTRTSAISLDAIEDIQVYVAPYDVKIGNFTGGSINGVTRSGTNTLSGSVYGFGRNAAITGPDRVGTLGKLPKDFHDYQAGFRLGFPIIRNKLFFFTNEELTRRVDPIQQGAGSAESSAILSLQQAQQIHDTTLHRYGFDLGTPGNYDIYSRSNKFFNRFDWNINDRNQFSLRNNTIFSQAVNLERDRFDFRFSSIAYQQVNNQTSTVAELKTRFNNTWSNSAIVGFTTIHDYRNPLSDPSFPQVQITGSTPGTTIFFGTDREGAIFNQKQRTIELTDNVTWVRGKHTVLFGTHNELYHINYGFVNSWNGRVDFNSVTDYLDNNPFRVRGSYNYVNDTRDYILAHPAAVFNVNFYSVYAQDEIRVADNFRITAGLRFDLTDVPQRQQLSDKTRNAYQDGFYGTTYTFTTPLQHINNRYFDRLQASPRLGFRYDILADQSLVLRGGAGLFTGRIPLAWLGYAFYNNGVSYGSYDTRALVPGTFSPGSNPVGVHGNGIGDFISKQGIPLNQPQVGTTQVDAIDNGFVMPKVARLSLAVDYVPAPGWKLTPEAIYTKVVKDVKFQQINVSDNPRYYSNDTIRRRQPIFPGNIDPQFSNAYLINNTSEGYRYSLSGTVAKSFPFGFDASASYTYGQSKDVSNGIRNSAESNWQLNQALNPNDPHLAYSNFDIRHRIIATLNYRKFCGKRVFTSFTLFFSAQSGSPFTYGFVNNSVQGTSQQVSLAYIPKRDEAVHFFQDGFIAPGGIMYFADQTPPAGSTPITAQTQADAFNTYFDGNKYLSAKRGSFTGRNEGRTPWNTQADFHFALDYHLVPGKDVHTLSFTVDVINLTNLISKDLGHIYFSPNTYNSTASVGLTPTLPQRQNPPAYPVYTFQNPGNAYSVDYFNSRYQFQLGLRYSF